jgi:hypothetical protein
MTINKSQGQSLKFVGVFLKEQVFTHGQLYVALSRVTSKKGLKIISCDQEGKQLDYAKNIVYKDVLSLLPKGFFFNSSLILFYIHIVNNYNKIFVFIYLHIL